MEEGAKTTAKKTPAQPISRKKGKEPDPQPPSRYLNLYEDIEDADDMSESEALKDLMDNAEMSEPTISMIPQASTSRTADPKSHSTALESKPAASYEDDISVRLKRLQETRRQVGF